MSAFYGLVNRILPSATASVSGLHTQEAVECKGVPCYRFHTLKLSSARVPVSVNSDLESLECKVFSDSALHACSQIQLFIPESVVFAVFNHA